MSKEPPGGENLTSRERQHTVDALCEAFAQDDLGIEEFERRVESAHRAVTNEELRVLLTDLPSATVPMKAPTSQLASAKDPVPALRPERRPYQGEVRAWSFAIGVMGGTHRSGQWVAAERNVGLAIMGGTTLDFREAALPRGVTDVHAIAICGGVEILVPPWLRVETSGVGIMGGFDHRHDAPAPDDPDAPVLRISGIALMGGVDVKVRLPGESARESRKRVAEERKAAKRLSRGGRDVD